MKKVKETKIIELVKEEEYCPNSKVFFCIGILQNNITELKEEITKIFKSSSFIEENIKDDIVYFLIATENKVRYKRAIGKLNKLNLSVCPVGPKDISYYINKIRNSEK